MEILDDDGSAPERPYTWIGAPLQDGPAAAGFQADLDEATGAPAIGRAPDPAAAPRSQVRVPQSREPEGRPSPASVLVAPETLGLTGVLVAVCTPLSSLPTIGLFTFTGEPSTPGSALPGYFTVVSAGGALALLLGIGALARLRISTPVASRAAAGAATLLGALLLVIGGIGIVHSTGPTGSVSVRN